MDLSLRRLVLPASQRRSIEELRDAVDLRHGDRRAKLTAFWSMLTLSAVIATAGVLSDSTATVIGAMIIAPLSTPIMGLALGIVTRERMGATPLVLLGALLVVLVGWGATALSPGSVDLASNSQVLGRTSPGLLDLAAAVATGLAGALALSRRDVAAVLPGVAIAISLVPPLAVVGVCLGEGDHLAAAGAMLLFTSNVVALVIAGTVLFAALGYADLGEHGRAVGARARSRVVLTGVFLLVLTPLFVNTVLVVALHSMADEVETETRRWLVVVPGAEVTKVEPSLAGFVVSVTSPQEPPSLIELEDALADIVPPYTRVTVELTTGRRYELGVVNPGSG
ncbi:DUF389 domain-containing protein [Phycicoccus sp. CSK15P-2]|uniref:DUF389 domain-containing protein n=1 Tax=Phycicoccus sp. CSK15P-2 TaxID=2807627 RepID=UPI00194FCF64|nr:DUF389 domain-containing protein [Phycicoccus sp. CSK15P-2]MBM6404415.1 DUF389 domain-containing protein [Phycicoccus sp. CSK15P-2]